jgi:Zn-dependent peptidase ImmA (M78 family)
MRREMPLRNTASKRRQRLNRHDIDVKAEEVMLSFDSHAFGRQTSPIYEVTRGFAEQYDVIFRFDQDLGYSKRKNKIFGRFDFTPRRILIDKLLPYDSSRFRWTLCHEIGHLVLHRRIDRRLITRRQPYFVDTREQLRFIRTAAKSELEWIEWQANQFASALLLPRPLVHTTIAAVQRELEIPRPGSIYVDDQRDNLRNYATIIATASGKLNVSRTVLRIRLLNLGILVDARPSYRDNINAALRALFIEA